MKALHGTRVIDLTQAMAAPFCTLNLGGMGADVIRRCSRRMGTSRSARTPTSCSTPAGAMKALGIPVKLSETPGAVDRPAPLVGQHTAGILTELGYSESEQRDLESRGVI